MSARKTSQMFAFTHFQTNDEISAMEQRMEKKTKSCGKVLHSVKPSQSSGHMRYLYNSSRRRIFKRLTLEQEKIEIEQRKGKQNVKKRGHKVVRVCVSICYYSKKRR